MDTNNQILHDIATRLEQSTKTNWERGDVEQWANHGRTMKSTINTVIPILKTLAKTPTPTSEPVEPLAKEQKVMFITYHSQGEVNREIDKGWRVKSVTPCSTNTSGEYCFLLER